MNSDDVELVMSLLLVSLLVAMIAGLTYLGGYKAGLNSYQRHACLAQGLEWINEDPQTQPMEDLPYAVEVTCVEPIVRVAP